MYSRRTLNTFLCTFVAAFTNHSRGELVYRKVSVVSGVEKNSGFEQDALPKDDSKPGAHVARIQGQGSQLEVLIRAEGTQDLVEGSIVEAQRSSPAYLTSQPRWISTARLKITGVRGPFALAQVLENGGREAKVLFGKDARLMVGDHIVVEKLQISQNMKILPTQTFRFKDLFVDPKGLPETFELSEHGRKILLEQAETLVQSRVPTLLVEAFTDPAGDRTTNQIESQQRALTIRQALIDAFAIDPTRIIAVGHGELEALAEPDLPGNEEEARRIVLRVNQD